MDSKSTRPPSATVELADDTALLQIERARHNNFVETLTSALKRLQETNSPPKRQTSWEMFIHGYFEFQPRSAKSSFTPTPGLTPSETSSEGYRETPTTSLTIDTPNTSVGDQEGETWKDKMAVGPHMMKGRKRMRTEEVVEIVSQRRITRSHTTDSDSLWQLDVVDGRPKMAYKRRKVG